MIIDKRIVLSLRLAFMYVLTVGVGILFVNPQGVGSAFWPAAGVVAVGYYLYRKNAYIAFIPIMVILAMINRLFGVEEPVYFSIIIGLFFVLSGLVEMILFTHLMTFFKVDDRRLDLLENGYKFIVVITIATVVGALISNFGLSLFYGFDGFLLDSFGWFIGNFLGILIFGSLLIYSHYRDIGFFDKENKYSVSILFILAYVIISFYIFAPYGNNFITFGNFQISLFIMYTIAAFKFNYKVIFAFNLIFLLMFGVFVVPATPTDDIVNVIVIHSIYLVSLSSIANLIKNVLYERNGNYLDLERARDNLEKLIISTNSLFDIQNELPDNIVEYHERYLIDMFELACDIYPKFSRASVNIKRGKYVYFLAVKGYDKGHLNQSKFLSDAFAWSLEEPEIVKETDYNKVFEKSQGVQEFEEKYGMLKESIRFTVIFNENAYAGMSFDLFEEDSESFTEYDIENFKSFQNLMNSYSKVNVLTSEKNSLKDGLVLSLVRTLELYDSYTGGHSEEVAELGIELGRKLHLKDDDLRHIYWSGVVHDIGKIGLDEKVLNKKGKLTDEEYELVKQHPVFGYDILSRADELEEVAKTVRHHHEWWNGKGYPDGLKSIQIPYPSQILHVCDAVSAMAKDRVYKKALTEEEIIDQLQTGLGKQFSPKVAKVMIKFIQDGELKRFLNKHNN